MALCPTNLGGYTASPILRRNLVTLLSADLDRPGATPYVWNPAADGTGTEAANATATRYGLAPAALATTPFAPSGGFIPFPSLASSRNTNILNSEFDVAAKTPPPYGTWRFSGNISGYTFTPGTWRYDPTNMTAYTKTLTTYTPTQLFKRLNLNRTLTAFPAPATTGLIDMTVAANLQQVRQAQSDRQAFAQDIFDVLRTVTGAVDPQTAYTSYGATSAEYNACATWPRWPPTSSITSTPTATARPSTGSTTPRRRAPRSRSSCSGSSSSAWC
jgi:hypothetical protein